MQKMAAPSARSENPHLRSETHQPHLRNARNERLQGDARSAAMGIEKRTKTVCESTSDVTAIAGQTETRSPSGRRRRRRRMRNLPTKSAKRSTMYVRTSPLRLQKQTPKQSDEEGHYHVVCGADITPRYKILDLMGQGTFAKVVEAWDRQETCRCAVKIVRATRKYTRDAECELAILERLRRKDPDDKYSFVKVRGSFRFRSADREHLAIIFPKLGPSLLDFINKNATFTLPGIAEMAQQMLSALRWLHCEVGMIHTDLKPENILLCESGYTHEGRRRVPRSYRVRIIDFGGATDEDHSEDSIVSTRHYRAPEVILGSGWMYPADIWSVGCILIELFTGDVLFDTHENREHLALMEQILGPMPEGFSKKISESARKYFRSDGSLRWPEMASSDKSIAKVEKTRPLEALCEDVKFIDLIRKLLDFDKTRRFSAEKALAHPFLKPHQETEDTC
eukprot:TRINITY_DN159_c0_g1_i1.p1 TRINITY_DN159_c0_g1~~TRINITY_DN159_c0_g1_i1.p1  ORF type:complete len:451 (-),score=53.70 TRINITY_DN159_c0_g1_i1:98-1450(-)